MCPLVSSPTRGYTDYQRVGNYDNEPFLNTTTTNRTTTYTSAIFDASRYAYLGAALSPIQGQCVVTFEWYSDPLGNTSIALRQFVLATGGPGTMQLRMPNLGPFVQMFVDPIAAGLYNLGLKLLATNRDFPLEVVPFQPWLISVQNQSIAAAGSLIVQPSDYYAGPLQYWCQTPNAQSTLNLEVLDAAGVWRFASVAGLVTGNNTNELIVPIGQWRMEISNNSAAAGNYYLHVRYTDTGAM